MAKGYVLYNEKAGSNGGNDAVAAINSKIKDEIEFIEISRVKDYGIFLSGLDKDDYIIICGGDGTLNRFANDTADIDFYGKIFYYPSGTGNDFAHDLGYTEGNTYFPITEYLKDLPTVTVKGKKYRFINGVGYGIDGYCCEVGDKLRETSTKPINYASIAIKGLLFHYKPTNASVTVDGESHTYKKVWLSPTMNGRFYGGGMMPTPSQNRIAKAKTVSTMVFHGTGKLRTLMIFPSLFKGQHIKHTKAVDILTGHDITVEFDRPVALQIDGETILGVTSYTVSTVKSKNYADNGLTVHQ